MNTGFNQWQGTWKTTHGELYLRQRDNRVYGDLRGSLIVEGSFNPLTRTLEGTYTGNRSTGRIRFVLNGNRFTGKWAQGNQEPVNSWNGTKQSSNLPVLRTHLWEGTWNSRYGELRLLQEGTRVYGDYRDLGTIEGNYSVTSRSLQGTFINRKKSGQFIFNLKPNVTNAFTGKWGWGKAKPSEDWYGNRRSAIAPVLTIYKSKGETGSLATSEAELSVRLSRTPGRHNVRSLGSGTEKQGEFVCRVQKKQISASYNNNLLLDPTTDVIWPGSILDGASITTGAYRPITANRAPLTFSISLENIQGHPSRTVAAPTLSTTRSAINQLLHQGMKGATPANIVYEKSEVYSDSHLQLKLGGHYSSGFHKVSAKFDFSSRSVTNKVIVKYLQRYYTIDIDPPTTPDGFFSGRRSIGENDMYVASVTYGRMLLFTFESTEDVTQLSAAIDYAFRGAGRVSVSTQYDKTLKNAKTNVLVLGGNAQVGTYPVTDGVRGIARYIREGANYSSNSPGVPLSYKLRYLKDNAIGNVLLSTTFYERQCTSTVGRFKVMLTKLLCTSVGRDEGSRAEPYGEAWVSAYERDGKLLGKYELWRVRSKSYLSLRRGESHTINQSKQFEFKSFPSIKDVAYIVVSSNIRDHDHNDSDDKLRLYRILCKRTKILSIQETTASWSARKKSPTALTTY
ncbi:MAG: thiol-activated cytolysin family protein [Cyanobacteria bacterium J06627_28]